MRQLFLRAFAASREAILWFARRREGAKGAHGNLPC
jgi:hypothetical protein